MYSSLVSAVKGLTVRLSRSASAHAVTGVSVPLGNYHNMDVAAKKIAAEYIDISDWKNMVKLFVRIARTGHEWKPGHALLKKRVNERFEKLKHLLT